MSQFGTTGNSTRGPGEIPAGVCPDCDGQQVLYTGGFGNEPNTAVTCPGCAGSGQG